MPATWKMSGSSRTSCSCSETDFFLQTFYRSSFNIARKPRVLAASSGLAPWSIVCMRKFFINTQVFR